ncbi:MAG: hypothetical protein ABI760_25965 [Ferruginibacter sp.]
MKEYIIYLLLLVNIKTMSKSMVQGEYYFRRQEMVAGFNFSANGKFQFFYSYGAVDRNATGSFFVEGDTLKLKSDKEAGEDFSITDQSKQARGYSIIFEHPNKYLLKDILCIFLTDGIEQSVYSDSNGEVKADLRNCDTIYVQHPLYPDIVTLVKDKNNGNSRFKLTLNPSLEQVSFKGINFKIEDDKMITCIPNYFMNMEGIEFIKR